MANEDGEEPVRVLLADDHPVYRDGLAMLLRSVPGIDVVGVAGDGTEVIALAADLQPDVVVMDVRMPGPDGIAATREIVSASPSIGVVVLTMSEEDTTVFAAMRAGARGYLLKGANQAEIVRAVTGVARGDVVFGPALARRIAEFFSVPGVPGVPGAPGAIGVFPELTAREREVLDLLAAGRSNQQIAGALYLSPKTVRNNVSNIFAKLHVADRAEAIVRARDAGLGRA